jgi:hypothetical protein
MRVYKRWLPALTLFIVVSLLPMEADDATAQASAYKASTTRWSAASSGFGSWTRSGVALTRDGDLLLDPSTALPAIDPYAPRTYSGRNFYNGGRHVVGEATSAIVTTPFAFTQAIPSWSADTPIGTWLEVQLRARIGTRWTRWYNLGVWASGNDAIERHSVGNQRDEDGSIATDTLILGTRQSPLSASAYQLKVRLFSLTRDVSPRLWGAAVAVSTTPARPATLAPGDRALWGKTLPVPQCSQMVYRDGGEVWCSPTTVSMMMGYWRDDRNPCEPRVRAAVSGVYDWVYRGHGNWSFNSAYLSSQGIESYVTRFTSLAEAEPWVAAGVPVAVSYGWPRGGLTGAPISSSNGHLALLVGFDPSGNPILHDPAAPRDAEVRRAYPRAQWERLWLEHSGGTAYIAYLPDWPIPGR